MALNCRSTELTPKPKGAAVKSRGIEPFGFAQDRLFRRILSTMQAGKNKGEGH